MRGAIVRYHRSEKLNYKGARMFVGAHMLPGDGIVLLGWGLPWLRFYFDDLQESLRQPQTADALDVLVEPGRRLWLVSAWDLGGTNSEQNAVLERARTLSRRQVVLPGTNANTNIFFLGTEDAAVRAFDAQAASLRSETRKH